ncbi:MAG: galactose oxidase-like domain-containing protein [Geminicoccaceae bacterium]
MEFRGADYLRQGAALPFHRASAARRLGSGRRRRCQHQDWRWPQTNTNAEIYYPPYLYDSTGRLVTSRPTITDAPTSLAAAQSFQMQVSSSTPVARLTLIKTGSVTHAFKLEQRFVELSYTTGETTLTAQVPSTRAALPPGRWMLLAFDADGVPSVAKLVSVATRSSARVGTDWTPAFGTGNDGTAFTAACPTGRVLAGVSGSADAKLRAVSPLCVSVNGSGSWIGNPVPGKSVGPGGGTAFSRTCPAGSAVSGLRGRPSNDVDAIDLECRKFGAGAVATGDPSYLGAVGGTGGLARNATDAAPTTPPTRSMAGPAPPSAALASDAGGPPSRPGFLLRASGGSGLKQPFAIGFRSAPSRLDEHRCRSDRG